MGLFFNKHYEEAVIHVEGMRCGICETHINDVVRRIAKVKSVKSSHRTGEVKIRYEKEIDLDAIKEAIKKEGYGVE